MKQIHFSKDVVPLGIFKAQAASWLERLRQNGHPVVITKNGKPAGILLSPSEFDLLQEREQFIESIASGLADAEAGRVMDGRTLQKKLTARREQRKAA